MTRDVSLAMSASERLYEAPGGSSALKSPEGDGTSERATRRDVACCNCGKIIMTVRNQTTTAN